MTDNERNPDDKKPAIPAAGQESPQQDPTLPSSVDAILKARLKLEAEQATLDKMLKDQFQKNITVLFTDIKGSTAYFETYGDVEGRTMVQRHNSMLFPVIEAHGGKVIKTIGDAIMATFDDPAQGVKSAIAMQTKLLEHNQAQDQKHRKILVRMGLNYGPAVVEETDVFGDAVNVSARVESQADAEQILISEDLYKQVRGDDEILVRFFGDVAVKGKTEPVKIYRVVWSDEQMEAEGEFKKAATRRTVDKRGKTVRGRVISLSVSREAKQMKISVFEHARGEERTVSQYDVVKVDDAIVKTQCDEITNLLNRANKRGKISKEILKQLQASGQILFDHLLTQEAKDKVLHTQAEHLVIRMDDSLVHVPWELLFDGKQFFCQRFAMGRIVATRQKVAESADRQIAKPLRMLVVSDPRSDLPASKTEGINIRDELDKEHEFINVKLKASEVPVNYLKGKIRDYDMIHYAGHADYDKGDPGNSGWLLSDGKLSSNEIKNMTGKKPMPALVFANACQSGQTDEWKLGSDYESQIFGLANAFLVSGVQHYIGTFWDILDDPGHDFALAFYKETIAGASVGEAVRRARLALVDKYGEDTIVWASYMLYGDPTFSYLSDVAEMGEQTEETVAATAAAPLTQPGQPAVFRGADSAAMARPAAASSGSKSTMIVIAAVVALAVVLGVYLMRDTGTKLPADTVDKGYALLDSGNIPEAKAVFDSLAKATGPNQALGLEGLAVVAMRQNDNLSAEQYAKQALAIDPQAAYANVVLGRMAYNKGAAGYNDAIGFFQAASQAQNGKDWQKNEAFEMLGKLYNAKGLQASQSGNRDAAMSAYRDAVKSNPNDADASINLGQSLMSMGKTAEAKDAFAQAVKADPNNQIANTMLAQAINSMNMAADVEKTAEVNRLAKDLAEQFKAGKMPPPKNADDDWTSRPFTVTLLDFVQKGQIAMEGQMDFIKIALTNALRDTKRVEVVDREMIDKVLSELNLSGGALASEDTRLQLGRIFGARIIATGSFITYGKEAQVNIRLIEVETTQVKVSISPVFKDKGPGEIAQAVADELVKQIKEAYPLQGKVAEAKGDNVKINIGSKVGVTKGQKLDVLDDDQLKVGSIEVTDVGPEVSVAKVVEKPGKIAVGAKVREAKD